MTQDYFVEPYDVLFFRGNKSFHFGEFYTEGVFPPYPSTFQGFVRNKILRDANMDDNPKTPGKDWGKIQGVVGNDADMPFDIYGPFLMAETGATEIFVRTPNDLYRDEKDKPACSSLFSPAVADVFNSDDPCVFRCLAMKKDKLDKLKPPDFINLDKLNDYRLGNKVNLPDEKPFITEDRVMIGLDDTAAANGLRGVKETRFCVTAYNRLQKNAGLYFSVKAKEGEEARIISEGPLRLGAETHPVYVRVLNQNIFDKTIRDTRKEIIRKAQETKLLRLALLQPGVFAAGWLPFVMQRKGSELVVEIDGLKLKLLFAFTESPVSISGYSFANNKNATGQKDDVKSGKTGVTLRQMVKAVPAGAVYCFSIVNEPSKDDIKSFVHKYDNKKIANAPYSLMGFNHVILAAMEKY